MTLHCSLQICLLLFRSILILTSFYTQQDENTCKRSADDRMYHSMTKRSTLCKKMNYHIVNAAQCATDQLKMPTRLRIKLSVVAIFVISITVTFFYFLWFTPLAVYILDRLNLRPFFLPNITCKGCNNFTYPYMVDNRNFCLVDGTRQRPVFLLMMVASFHANLDARQAIRKSWGGVREYRGQVIRTLFIFGRHDDKNYNYQVEYELQHYGDVMQADFMDSYKWLTNKTIMGLRWIEEFCPNVRYVLKTDDDGFNVPQRFVDYLLGIHMDRFIGGYCFTVMPDRRKDSKFYIPVAMYPDRYYPTYCYGPGYILSRSAISAVLGVANDAIFLHMEDVFVSGICRVVAGILYTQIIGVAEDQRQMTRCNLATWVKNGHNIYPQATPVIWSRVVDGTTDCFDRNGLVFVILFVFLAFWSRHVYSLIRPGLSFRASKQLGNLLQ